MYNDDIYDAFLHGLFELMDDLGIDLDGGDREDTENFVLSECYN